MVYAYRDTSQAGIIFSYMSVQPCFHWAVQFGFIRHGALRKGTPRAGLCFHCQQCPYLVGGAVLACCAVHHKGALLLFSPGEKYIDLFHPHKQIETCILLSFWRFNCTKVYVIMKGRQTKVHYCWCSDISLLYMYNIYLWKINPLKTSSKYHFDI